ncbi:MAG: hypothetical protein KDD63_23360, partial [Bacteroidetes bacterium]|nr:hypothetical protein [Bacteroidota bacterium]
PGKKKKHNDEGISLGTFQDQQKTEGDPGDAGLYQINSYNQPLYFDENLKSTQNTLPLSNVKVKLVIHYILNGYEYMQTGNQTYTRDGYLVPDNGLLLDNGKTLAVTYTDANGNYQFNYSQVDSMLMLFDYGKTGFNNQMAYVGGVWDNKHFNSQSNLYFEQVECKQAVRVLRLEVESPYYCSPEVNMLIQPGQIAQVPTQVSEVRSYHLQVQAFGDTTKNQTNNKHKILQGMTVEILRGTFAPEEIPTDEGQELGEPGPKGWEVISRGETDKSGKALFGHLVRHNAYNSHDRYQIRAYSKQSNTLDYYETDWKLYPIVASYPIPGQPYNGKHIVYNSEYSPDLYETDIILEAGKPRIRGRVIQVASKAEVPLDSVKVYLNLKPVNAGPDNFPTKVILTDAQGYFEFNDLPNNYSGHISFYRNRYYHEIFPVPQLKMGTLFLPNDGIVKMVPMGKVYGYVANEAGEPIPADVKLGDGPLSPTELVIWSTGGKKPSSKNRFDPPPGTVVQGSSQQMSGAEILKYRFMFGAESGMNLP